MPKPKPWENSTTLKEYGPVDEGPLANAEPSRYAQRLAGKEARGYTAQEIAKREAFIREFVKDWSVKNAAIRAGIPAAGASKQGSELMNEKYVQKRINEYIESIDEEVLIDRKKVIVGLMKEATNFGPGSSSNARVQAWKVLGKYLGMEITNVNVDITHKGNVMIIPGVGSDGRVIDAEEWSAVAAESQHALKKDVRE